MKLSFVHLDLDVVVDETAVSVVQVEDRELFQRMATSLCSKEGEEADEPFAIWQDGLKRLPASQLIVLSDCLNLPFENNAMTKAFINNFTHVVRMNESDAFEINDLATDLFHRIGELTLSMSCNYEFALDWDLAVLLKSFKLLPRDRTSHSYLEKWIAFIDFLDDINHGDWCLVAINLKSFLKTEDIEMLYKHVISRGFHFVILESWVDPRHFDYERKYRIDEDIVVFSPDD